MQLFVDGIDVGAVGLPSLSKLATESFKNISLKKFAENYRVYCH